MLLIIDAATANLPLSGFRFSIGDRTARYRMPAVEGEPDNREAAAIIDWPRTVQGRR